MVGGAVVVVGLSFVTGAGGGTTAVGATVGGDNTLEAFVVVVVGLVIDL